MSQKLANYVIFQRKIAADYRDEIINKDEFLIYTWLRLNADPYGISVTSLSSLGQDLFGKEKTENSINKLLLSLKRKKFLFYKKRTGSRGSFRIHFGGFILPTKAITSLDKLFEEEEKANSMQKNDPEELKLGQNSSSAKQNLNSAETIIKSMTSKYRTTSRSRAYNNDTNKDKENDNK